MKPFVRPLLAAAIACSAVLSTAPVFASAQTPDATKPDDAPRAARRGHDRRGAMRERMIRDLGLTDEQRARFDEIRGADRDALRASRQAVAEKRKALREAMLADPSNQASLDGRLTDLNAAQADLRRRALATQQRLFQVLTPEQRERIRAMRAERGQHKRDRLQRLR